MADEKQQVPGPGQFPVEAPMKEDGTRDAAAVQADPNQHVLGDPVLGDAQTAAVDASGDAKQPAKAPAKAADKQ